MCPFCGKKVGTLENQCEKCLKDYRICSACASDRADACTICRSLFCRKCRLPSLGRCNQCLMADISHGQSETTAKPSASRSSSSAASTKRKINIAPDVDLEPMWSRAARSVATTDTAGNFSSSSSSSTAMTCEPSISQSSVPAPPGVRIVADNVACPGQPLPVTAIGTPRGGTFSWLSNGDIAQGPNRPDCVMLFQLEPGEVEIRVTYRVGSTDYVASKNITVHDVNFASRALQRFAGVVEAQESDDGLLVATGKPANREADAHETAFEKELSRATDGEAEEAGGCSASAFVRITLPASCPFPATCAANWRVGFLQNLNAGTKTRYYGDDQEDLVVSVAFDPALPAVDSHADKDHRPFYDSRLVKTFSAPNEELFVIFSDSPACALRDGTPLPWQTVIDNDAVNADFGHLRRVMFQGTFHLWLAVENRTWATFHRRKPMHHARVRDAYILLQDFTWSFQAQFDIDRTRLVGERTSHAPVQIALGHVNNGQGAPVVLENTAEERMTTVAVYDETQIPTEMRVQMRFALTGELPDLPQLDAGEGEDDSDNDDGYQS